MATMHEKLSATDLSTLLAAVTALGQTGVDYGDAQGKIVAQFS